MQQQKQLGTVVDGLLEQVQAYGIKDITVCEYQVVCHKLLSYAQEKGDFFYSKRLTDEFLCKEETRCHNGDICLEYFRFIRRAIRMLVSYAETDSVDFTSAPHKKKKYIPSENSQEFIRAILDSAQLYGGSRYELDAVMRHFFCYIEDKGLNASGLTDDDFFDFMLSVASVTNAGSIGRTFRGLRYIHDYLKNNHVSAVKANLSMLQFKNAKIRMIPPFSQEEISSMVEAAFSEGSSVASRDYAVLLLGFDTGLRGADIQKLKLSDIDWKKATVTVRQSKTGQPITLPLHGAVMNAVADYILKERPECEFREIFITSKAPYHPIIAKGCFNRIIRKYSDSSGIERKPKRGFHSLRRSFATEMSLAGVALPTISQMLGHKDVTEDRPYLSYNREQVSFVAMDFSDVPIRNGIYHSLLYGSLRKGGDPE